MKISKKLESDSLIFKILKLILFTFENYKKSRSDLWSSALTFYSLLTIVPVIAIAFVITRGFGIEKMIKDELYKTFFLEDKLTLTVHRVTTEMVTANCDDTQV